MYNKSLLFFFFFLFCTLNLKIEMEEVNVSHRNKGLGNLTYVECPYSNAICPHEASGRDCIERQAWDTHLPQQYDRLLFLLSPHNSGRWGHVRYLATTWHGLWEVPALSLPLQVPETQDEVTARPTCSKSARINRSEHVQQIRANWALMVCKLCKDLLIDTCTRSALLHGPITLALET